MRLLSAGSADAALRHALAEEDRLAAVLLDVMMPCTDGPATARPLRARARTAHVPVVFVTALDADGRAAALGAVRFPARPGRPLSDAVLGGTSNYLHSREESDARYPEMAPVLGSAFVLWLPVALLESLRTGGGA